MAVVGVLDLPRDFIANGSDVRLTTEISSQNWNFELSHNGAEDSWTVRITKPDLTQVFLQKIVLDVDYPIDNTFVLAFRDLGGDYNTITAEALSDTVIATFVEGA